MAWKENVRTLITEIVFWKEVERCTKLIGEVVVRGGMIET